MCLLQELVTPLLETMEAKERWFKHHFHASTWTDHHPRYKHPINDLSKNAIGNTECVKLWDKNVAFFEALPEEEQLKMISIKELYDWAKRPVLLQRRLGTEKSLGALDAGTLHLKFLHLGPLPTFLR